MHLRASAGEAEGVLNDRVIMADGTYQALVEGQTIIVESRAALS